jgi:hypothetical protein
MVRVLIISDDNFNPSSQRNLIYAFELNISALEPSTCMTESEYIQALGLAPRTNSTQSLTILIILLVLAGAAAIFGRIWQIRRYFCSPTSLSTFGTLKLDAHVFKCSRGALIG